jgi:D-beta-D-heptose 7-phosphate kinase/D-beta-D-heptose 1-phosphate adenosyltransferase
MIHKFHEAVQSIERDWHSNIHVVVVGDVMLDKYIWGEVKRVSPEAPVPVVRAPRTTERPGGAANVAMNLAGLGARVKLMGFAGGDRDQSGLEAHLQSAGVESRLVTVDGIPTTSKLRIFGGNQQMLRLDVEPEGDFCQRYYDHLLAQAMPAVRKADVLVLSDYAKGALSEEVCACLLRQARQSGITALVAPKAKDFRRYRGATAICPNLEELAVATGESPHDPEKTFTRAQAMIPELGVEYLIVTLAEKGIALLRRDSRATAPTVARQMYDSSGAGDTVIATLALCLASGLPTETAIQLANVAAGIVVSRVGTVSIDRHELLAALLAETALNADEKVLTMERLIARVASWRALKRKIVLTNGCYDLLHIGHITLLEKAKQEGDKLIVAINSDRSVGELKGPERPLVGQRQRAQLLAALSAVDAVVIFDEPTPIVVIEALRPDVIVKGGDYTEELVVGAQEVKSWGGEVKLIPLVDGFSSTRLMVKAAGSGD